ncbi:MAG TPA: hypothetical protein VKQ54_04445 [Caulobacteraceae bacterium]|nr:hypothetical protein [Caulobacteraceae bacterium]
MSASIRPAAIADLPEMAELLIAEAGRRSALDRQLWPVATDAHARLDTALRAGLEPSNGPVRELWRLAEASGRIVGVTHAMIVPVPPIYGAEAPPGLLLDDCFTTTDAPRGTAETLLAATEAALRATGAATLIASCPAAASWRGLYERHDYEAVTLYMAKHGFTDRALAPGVRPAGAEDVPAIVKLSADHRKTLSQLNPRFWSIHPQADGRFDAWMRHSLTLKDRDMFVAQAPGGIRGYVIAQGASPLLIPVPHDIAAIGVIDDFYDLDFADVRAVSNAGAGASDLLSAAERAFARRAFDAALAVCPAAWTSKVSLLEREGYRTAKLWLLKR